MLAESVAYFFLQSCRVIHPGTYLAPRSQCPPLFRLIRGGGLTPSTMIRLILVCWSFDRILALLLLCGSVSVQSHFYLLFRVFILPHPADNTNPANLDGGPETQDAPQHRLIRATDDVQDR